ncbi:MAG TPA: hypothetical protein VMQ17_08835 [Candidatus Sulfotelmatobacter sp.]|nr:hypothetical protein [Candidatus Sulfotelmatobacter sp.]
MDPFSIDPHEYEYYKQVHPPRVTDYTKRTPEQMARDITVCHDNLRRQIRINDKLVAQLEREKIWRRVLISAVVGQWTVLLILFKWGLPLAMKGLGK